MNINLIRAAEIASILKISRAFAYRLISEGKIPSVHMGKSVRVRAEDLEKYIQDNLSGQGLPVPVPDLSILSRSKKTYREPRESR